MVLRETISCIAYSVINFFFSYTEFVINDTYAEVSEVFNVYQFHIPKFYDGFRAGSALNPSPGQCFCFGKVSVPFLGTIGREY